MLPSRPTRSGASLLRRGYPPTVFDDHPEAIRDVLRMLVESGAATLPPADDQPGQEQEHQRQDNDEGTAPTAVSV